MLAWHFLPEDRKLRWGMREVVLPGLKLAVPPPLKMCYHGLHAGIRAIDALRYAPGPVVCRVELGGEILEDEDKCCATERTCVWLADASEVLHRFACWCAERVLMRERQAGREPAAASWAAVQAKRDWQAGKITGQELAAAETAAWAGALGLASVDAGRNLRSGAWDFAWDAAVSAAKCAAWSAARGAAWRIAWSAAEFAAACTVLNATKGDIPNTIGRDALIGIECGPLITAERDALRGAESIQNEELTRVLLLLEGGA